MWNACEDFLPFVSSEVLWQINFSTMLRFANLIVACCIIFIAR